MKIITNSAKETIELGSRLGRALKAGDVIGLTGEFGSGKTTFVKGLALGLGVSEEEHVSSPSFVLIREYSGRLTLFHFDLYRLEEIDDIGFLGVDEYLFDNGVCVIEWAEKMKELLPDSLKVKLSIAGENKREFEFFPADKRYKVLVDKLREV